MTSSQITGGTVKWIDPSNYQSGKEGVEVTIHFSVQDGADAAEWQATGDMARSEAQRLARGKPPRPVQAAPVETAPVPDPKKRAKAPPPPVEVPVVDSTDPVIVGATEPSTSAFVAPGFVDDPAAIGEPEEVVAEGPPPAIAIADIDIRKSVERAVTEGKVSNKAIIGLITEFTGSPGKSMTTIGQEQRGDFLARLKKLYANA